MKSILPCLVLFSVASVIAQPVDSLWCHIYVGEAPGIAHVLLATPDGGALFAGQVYTIDTRGDAWIVKTDVNGDTVWSRSYGGTYDDHINSMTAVSTGGWILGGFTKSFHYSYFGGDVWLLRIDDNGDTLWTRRYGDIGLDECYAVKEQLDGGFVVVAKGDTIPWRLLQLNTNGDSLASIPLAIPSDIRLEDVEQTADGGFIFGGATTNGSSFSDAWLMKTDAFGAVEWSHTYGVPVLSQTCNDLLVTGGGFIFTGQTVVTTGQPTDVWLVKVNLDGDTLWTKTFGTAAGEVGEALTSAPQDGIAIAATRGSSWEQHGEAWLIRTDASGDSLWSRIFDSPAYEHCVSLVMEPDGGYMIAGDYVTFSPADTVWLLKTTPDALQTPDNSPLPDAWALNVYPNPFNSATTIKLSLTRSGRAKMEIYNVMGQLLRTLADGVYPAGTHDISLSADDLPSGIYFVHLSAPNVTATQKLMLLK